jgi:hypothetical protein
VVSERLIGSRFPETPVGSTTALSFYFTFEGSGNIGAPLVLTQGAAGLDFTDAGTGSCTTNGASHTYSAGSVCTVNVQFKPTHPGPRLGAVELTTTGGTPIGTAYASGVGKSPQVVFSSNNMQSTLGGGFAIPTGVAEDGSGNVFVADYGNTAVKQIPASCVSDTCVKTVGGGFKGPMGVAVDGSGNIFVAISSSPTTGLMR